MIQTLGCLQDVSKKHAMIDYEYTNYDIVMQE
jgi:hypothetical protein